MKVSLAKLNLKEIFSKFIEINCYFVSLIFMLTSINSTTMSHIFMALVILFMLVGQITCYKCLCYYRDNREFVGIAEASKCDREKCTRACYRRVLDCSISTCYG